MKKLFLLSFSLVFIFLFSCKNKEKKLKIFAKIDYKKIKELAKKDSAITLADTANVFDKQNYNPATDSIKGYLDTLKLNYQVDSFLIKKLNVKDNDLLNDEPTPNSLMVINNNDSLNNKIEKSNPKEIIALKYNLTQLQNKDTSALNNTSCKQSACRVWCEVSKKRQKLFLHIDNVLVDSFLVSTGDKNHETPTFDLRPSGPIFQKYSSKKFPGGNYNGLGNMPYAVFIKGGYALHGTTSGNIPKLGKKASHGCVRLHPNNAKIINETIKAAGIENTWVTITND